MTSLKIDAPHVGRMMVYRPKVTKLDSTQAEVSVQNFIHIILAILIEDDPRKYSLTVITNHTCVQACS